MGYKVEPVEGYNLKEHPEIKPNQVVYLNLKKKIQSKIQLGKINGEKIKKLLMKFLSIKI